MSRLPVRHGVAATSSKQSQLHKDYTSFPSAISIWILSGGGTCGAECATLWPLPQFEPFYFELKQRALGTSGIKINPFGSILGSRKLLYAKNPYPARTKKIGVNCQTRCEERPALTLLYFYSTQKLWNK